MMDSVSPETCWAIKKYWNNKFYYTAASCWFFLWDLCVRVLRILFYYPPPSKSPLLCHFTPFELNMFTASQIKHKAQQMLRDSCSRVYISLRVSLLTHKLTHTQKELFRVTFEHCFHRKSNYLWQFKFAITPNAHTHTYTYTYTHTHTYIQCRHHKHSIQNSVRPLRCEEVQG